ncbi:hypothetical protein PROFUN_09019 [Planoprotostelium fungivorum]|uniref:Uncharacterized protein n=1 Tax=Planoprotostelium fungivorum TaxID=1890364 RepID=A0A2P6MV19_9EUKA|nr:hypothetical protein PROFUN_09019 [Planoprotostelium fungivorum]
MPQGNKLRKTTTVAPKKPKGVTKQRKGKFVKPSKTVDQKDLDRKSAVKAVARGIEQRASEKVVGAHGKLSLIKAKNGKKKKKQQSQSFCRQTALRKRVICKRRATENGHTKVVQLLDDYEQKWL